MPKADPRFRSRPSLDAMQRQVEAFNERCPVGGRVSVRPDRSKEAWTTATTTEAYVLGGHTPVVHLEGISGCYLLDRVTPIASEVLASD